MLDQKSRTRLGLFLVVLLSLIQTGFPEVEEPVLDWVLVTENAGFQPRDSQGEVVFQDKLWILGGWFDSFKPAPRDIWCSEDGKSWKKEVEEAPWKHSDLAMSLVAQDRMWMMGGWFDGRLPTHEAGNEVWSSRNGRDWEQVAKHAGWSPRIAAGALEFKNKMWILGGTEDYYFGDEKSLKNDVWSSENGQDWSCVTKQAGWSPRAYHQAVVLGDRMYVLGGGNYVPEYHAKNDVWSSEDGEHWELATEAAPWSPRLWFSAVTYRDRIWVLGGWTKEPYKNWGDIWYSADGKNWTEYKAQTTWKARHEHSALVFKDRLWVISGHAMPLSNDVWSLELPKDFDSRKLP